MSLGLTAPPVLLGLYIGARRRLMESLRERADSLEQELSLLADRAEQRAQWARNEERTRIAREMHDVVAHRVSLMVVHAAALQAVALKDPQKAVKNAALVGDMGRQALTELREMLGVLRTGDGRSRVGREPVPLAAVGSRRLRARGPLTASGRGRAVLWPIWRVWSGSRGRRGWSWSCRCEGEARAYAPEVEQTAYRVVQEALTNVHKHAAGAKAHGAAGASRGGDRDAGGERPPRSRRRRRLRAAAERGERSGGDAGAGWRWAGCSCRGRRMRVGSGCRRCCPAGAETAEARDREGGRTEAPACARTRSPAGELSPS